MDCKLRAKNCGGCPLLGLDYAEQLKQKEEKVRALVGKYGPVHPIRGMEQPYHYRNKVISTFATGWGGKLTSGIYAANSHKVLPVESCLLQDEVLDKTMQAVRAAANACRYQSYDEDKGTGLLRHCLLRRGVATGQVMVVLVTAQPVLPGAKNFVKALLTEAAQRGVTVTTVVQNVNSRKTSVVLGEAEKVLYGKGFILDTLCGKTYAISPRSFYQVNPAQTAVLYGLAVEAAKLTGKEVVLDAYCGIGTIGLTAADHAKQVVGVELNRDAVQDAIGNARHNGVKNARFFAADATRWIREAAAAGEKADVIFMDPPREGSTPEFLASVARMAPKRVVYVSCNPVTLARDLATLTKLGYKAEGFTPVDMFPHTEHVETVVLLSKGEIDSKKVRVEFSLEDMDMSGFQKGATYEQIKAYVLEHTGLKVSSLYISQIKRKCGLDVGQNYNLSKKEDAKVPKCPPEKEAAIRDALKYFQMI
ncbi:23S rRNA (uracil-5-)-methyltransferase RumA [Faecalibacterium prausnitzii SL3/3]|uniref:23S rRNA (Uracil-5-)-methyltransferase RumA n=1 Tax=Faecalibacterium prausnitzii SL3/3 TaxID=657322 RepID=D4K9U4_9FIRM|nr:23S rRNA (uracil(1939)-C(5))-methyltransferase RlmD [Faecalibacterium prausnitzii]CBL01607.1 23S rRNA (uracil-5-)-methyltransferase RumA [Faecalibacterium prausnitzii SL3/3]